VMFHPAISVGTGAGVELGDSRRALGSWPIVRFSALTPLVSVSVSVTSAMTTWMLTWARSTSTLSTTSRIEADIIDRP